MTPTADYSCNSKKCRTEDGAAPVYELPINSLCCPKCGSKRIQRLYNKIAILRGSQPERDARLTSNSHAVRAGYLLRTGFDHHDSVKPGYTQPVDDQGYKVADPMRYDKLTSIGLRPDDVAGIIPGKGKPLESMEIMRERRQNPDGIVATIAAMARGQRPPTIEHRDPRPIAQE